MHTVLGGAVLLAIATVASMPGPVPALDLSCCTADATTAKAEVRGVSAPPVDSWVSAVTPGAAEAWRRSSTRPPRGGCGSRTTRTRSAEAPYRTVTPRPVVLPHP
ncbi:hypothetical protein [Streptomyces sp. WAC04114]|uniref:hypothetical protein n=1 Tax=Streptomyces sp. WAC04114 TaxID=2867961 RepID=UPI001C8C199A|nr:hypothetical protein [Streptomyces sp. WAC04114]MBX9363489.1 hypothetical protein [Streptomyces sp. WAC04114]